MSEDSPPNDPAVISEPTAAPGMPASSFDLDRVDRHAFLLTTLLAFAGYWFSLAPNVTLEMSGLFSTGAMYAGVPHQPGYPAWTLYSWLWTKVLPFGPIAWRVSVGSAAASAVACGLVAMAVTRVAPRLFTRSASAQRLTATQQNVLRMAGGSVAGLVFGFSSEVWGKAVVADVWAFSLLLFVALLSLLFHWSLAPQRRWPLYGAFFLYGWLLTSHQQMIVLFPGLGVALLLLHPALGRDAGLLLTPIIAWALSEHQYAPGSWLSLGALIYYPLLTSFGGLLAAAAVLVVIMRKMGTEIKPVAACMLAFLCGLAFYIYMPVAAMTNPPVNWGYARTLEGFRHNLGRDHYEKTCVPSGYGHWSRQAVIHWQASGSSFGWLRLGMAFLPVACWTRHEPWGRRWLLAGAGLWLCTDPLLLTVLNPSFAGPSEEMELRLSLPYYAPANAVLYAGFGCGLIFLGRAFVARTLRARDQPPAQQTRRAP